MNINQIFSNIIVFQNRLNVFTIIKLYHYRNSIFDKIDYS